MSLVCSAKQISESHGFAHIAGTACINILEGAVILINDRVLLKVSLLSLYVRAVC